MIGKNTAYMCRGGSSKNLEGGRYFVGVQINAFFNKKTKISYSKGCKTSGKWALSVVFIVEGWATAPNWNPLDPSLYMQNLVGS